MAAKKPPTRKAAAKKSPKKPKLPASAALHTDPKAPASPEQKPLPAAMQKKPVEKKSPAEWAYERLILYIQNFEEQLDSEHEAAMGFTGATAGVMRIEGIGYFDPDIITFYGSDEAGTKTQLIQHVSQLGVTLRAVPKPESESAARRIGFRMSDDADEAEKSTS